MEVINNRRGTSSSAKLGGSSNAVPTFDHAFSGFNKQDFNKDMNKQMEDMKKNMETI